MCQRFEAFDGNPCAGRDWINGDSASGIERCRIIDFSEDLDTFGYDSGGIECGTRDEQFCVGDTMDDIRPYRVNEPLDSSDICSVFVPDEPNGFEIGATRLLS